MKKFSFIIVFALICLNCFISVNAAEINNPPTVSAGYDHTVAVTATGELYAWGHNQYGQIGDGTTTSRYTPVKIMSDVKTAVAGSSYTLAIKNDGTLWAWGNNAWGNFGNGTKSQTNKTPIKITDNVEKVCVGDNTTFIIKTDKTLWGCGWNNDFKLGSGYGMLDECELSFIKILDNVSDVFIPEMLAAGFALKTDGTLYAWGTDHILESLDPPAEVPDIRQWIDYSVWYPIRIDTNIAECEFVDDVLHCLKNNGTYTYYATETFNYRTLYVNQARYESKNSKKLVHPTESISISNGNYTLYTKNGTTNLYGNGILYISAIGDDYVSKNSNKLLFDNFYYAEFSKNPDVQSVFVITTDGNLWAWGGNSYGNVGAGSNTSYDKPTIIMNLGAAKKSYEEYFADNIDGYIGQITDLKLPHDYLGDQADAKGITSWSLFYNQLNESNLLGADTLIEGKFFYETILLQIVSNEVRSNEYIESLKGQVLDVATSAISSAVTNQKLSVLQKKKSLEYSDYKTICKELELLTGIRTGIDVSEQLYKTAKNFDDVVKMWCEYNVAAKASTEIYLALEETAKECEDSYLRNALYSVADKYKMSISRTFQEAYGNKTADILITTITKAAVGELLDGYGINALSAARLFFDTAELTTNVIYPLSNTTESICFIKSVQTLESYVKLALYNSVSEYNTNKTYENAQKVVGLYDLLMKVYDYGMNESKLYAEYHYNTGLFNGIYNVFSNNNQIEYEDTISWINSYNGALNDVKWYRTKTEIEYGFETGTLVPVVVNTYFAGKVVDSVADIISNGSIYNPPAGGTLNLPTFFNDITLSVTTSGYYYDSAFTKPYVATNLTTPVTLYKQVTIQRHPRVVVNGQEVTFPDQKPILEDGRTLVPARGVFEALGATVSWNGNTNTATIRTNSKDITITIGQKYIVVNAKRIPIDVPAKIINNRTMIPLRAVAEALECEVGWDGATYAAIIEN